MCRYIYLSDLVEFNFENIGQSNYELVRYVYGNILEMKYIILWKVPWFDLKSNFLCPNFWSNHQTEVYYSNFIMILHQFTFSKQCLLMHGGLGTWFENLFFLIKKIYIIKYIKVHMWVDQIEFIKWISKKVNELQTMIQYFIHLLA